MKFKNIILTIIEAIFWYAALYTFIYTIKYDVDIRSHAFIILFFAYVAGISCPLVHHMSAWKKLWHE